MIVIHPQLVHILKRESGISNYFIKKAVAWHVELRYMAADTTVRELTECVRTALSELDPRDHPDLGDVTRLRAISSRCGLVTREAADVCMRVALVASDTQGVIEECHRLQAPVSVPPTGQPDVGLYRHAFHAYTAEIRCLRILFIEDSVAENHHFR